MINFWGSLKGLWWRRTVSAKIGKDPNKLGSKWVTRGSMMWSLERAWAENWVSCIFLAAAVPADIVTLGKSFTLWRLILLCSKLKNWTYYLTKNTYILSMYCISDLWEMLLWSYFIEFSRQLYDMTTITIPQWQTRTQKIKRGPDSRTPGEAADHSQPEHGL